MAGEQHVVAGRQATEHVVLNHVVRFILKEQIAFVLIHVHTQRADFLRFQRFDSGLRVDQSAAAGIDDHHAVFHLVERRLVKQVIVFRGQRTVQGDNIRLREERFQIDILHAQLQRSGAWVRIKRQQAHAKSFQDA